MTDEPAAGQDRIVVRPIGVIRTSLITGRGAPLQSSMSTERGTVVVYEEYAEGLLSLDEFSHIILLYWFHRAREPELTVVPYMDQRAHGVFATRAPARPNPIGISVVRVLRVHHNVIEFEGADMLDGTPLIDIKPFVPEFDNRTDASSGWLARRLSAAEVPITADDRFERRRDGSESQGEGDRSH